MQREEAEGVAVTEKVVGVAAVNAIIAVAMAIWRGSVVSKFGGGGRGGRGYGGRGVGVAVDAIIVERRGIWQGNVIRNEDLERIKSCGFPRSVKFWMIILHLLD
ncbi:glycine-rich protein 2-like [Pyrus ussuriensis x Pyrus communis]|uniref:Glycine-rich protein 2-like n=1 Tax=Pyrus ussuriensis x Pyrus communis TaxID=2448454 RepID=A0A5N5HS54_9ROSA|nr:glycine-rich protein 2-like [Pyrus ussuriensis x Pyrus communis]